MADTSGQEAPVLTVVNADATPEEIAALVAVLAALGPAPGDGPTPRRPAWSRPARGVRHTYGGAHHTGADGWRASGLPR